MQTLFKNKRRCFSLEKLDFLIKYLLDENAVVNIDNIPTDILKKKNLYRALCNVREPKPISKEYLKIENEYLQEELQKKNITKVEDIKPIDETTKKSNLNSKDKICLWQGDITTLQIDCIVNAANSQGLGCFVPCHKCIDNAIHSSGGIQLRLECNEKMKNIKKLETGKAFITKGYNLPSKFVIHTVGPIIYDNVTEKEIEELKNCYINSLEIAKENNIKEIAFCSISTGEFKFPKMQASKIAIKAVNQYLGENPNTFKKIIFNVFSDEDYSIYLENLR